MRRKIKSSENHWISFSDMMTGLMVIFMFVAISFMEEIHQKNEERDNLFRNFATTKNEIYEELNKTFGREFKQWEMVLDKDLSIKFMNPDIFFESGSSKLQPQFINILTDFLPRYFSLLMQPKYEGKIAEIRIEGHTDSQSAYWLDQDPYIANIKLSQSRATSILKYLRTLPYYQTLSDEDKNKIEFLTTANGLSYGRTLDNERNLTYFSKQMEDRQLSRRVEFKIVPNNEDVINKALKGIVK